MIYLIGGAPRTGKSILGQRFAAKQRIGWISTDLLMDLLRVKGDEGIKTEWNANPQAIMSNAEWFFPYLNQFVWSIDSQSDDYLIEGVDFLPTQVAQLTTKYQIQPVFLGCSKMTQDRFDRFPGKSKGYAKLPKGMRQKMVRDIPLWSNYIQQESNKFDYQYIDMSVEFQSRLDEAEDALSMVTKSDSHNS